MVQNMPVVDEKKSPLAPDPGHGAEKIAGEDNKLTWAARTNTGKVRTRNEDAFYVEPEIHLFMVSDGMGGHRGGREASSMIAMDFPSRVETALARLKKKSVNGVKSILRKTIHEQNRHVELEGKSETGYEGMGATIVSGLLIRNRFFIVNVGDSRAYLLRRGTLKQITTDMTVATELVREGKLEPELAQDHHTSNLLVNYVGMPEEPEIHIHTFTPRKDDLLLLCSDGLTDMVADEEIRQILEGEWPLEDKCRRLVEKANRNGGYDNITVLAIQCKITIPSPKAATTGSDSPSKTS